MGVGGDISLRMDNGEWRKEEQYRGYPVPEWREQSVKVVDKSEVFLTLNVNVR